jgi:predicted negative regulator of RcsB-dependent stress response
VAEHFTEEEQIEAIKSWWKENGTPIMASIAIVAVGMISWNVYKSTTKENAEAASAIYANYLETRSNSDSGDAFLKELEESHSSSGYHLLTLFHQASDAVAAEDLDTSAKKLQEIISKASSDEIKSLAIIRLAKIQHEQGLSDEALSALTQVKGDGYVSLAAELKGDILLSKGEPVEALAAYTIAKEMAGINAQRPLLEMKLADLANNDDSLPK